MVISAPSGVGKTTLKDMLIKEFPGLKYSISATTRKPREGEVDGVHYFFKTKDEFHYMIENNELVEYMEVHGNFYGTPKQYLIDQVNDGHNVILDLDVYGKVNFDKEFPDAVGVLILPPSFEVLEERLRNRMTDSDETIQLRLKNARAEMSFAEDKGKYEHQLVNDDLQQCYQEFRAIYLS